MLQFGVLNEQTKFENPILYICDFRRGVLNVRLRARIQHLLPDHKYRVWDSQTSVSWLLGQISGGNLWKKAEEIGYLRNKMPKD